jgi:hypothetical protein
MGPRVGLNTVERILTLSGIERRFLISPPETGVSRSLNSFVWKFKLPRGSKGHFGIRIITQAV